MGDKWNVTFGKDDCKGQGSLPCPWNVRGRVRKVRKILPQSAAPGRGVVIGE